MKPTFKQRLLLGSITLAFAAPAAFGATETFNTPGTFNWVCPADITSIQVECWGGGGAGGAATGAGTAASNTSRNGGGGGGGAYARKAFVPVTPGFSYTITIPAAAISGTNGTTTNGGGAVPGSAVTFVGNGGTTVTAAGGAGGANAYATNNGTTGQPGGAGATTAASIGDVGAVFAGGAGSAGNTGGTNVSGSGGGAGGDSSAGGAGFTSTASPYVGAGAGGVAGGGAGGVGRTGIPATSGNSNTGPGTDGGLPGGGGGGAKSQSVTSRLGGLGGIGQIVITTPDIPIVKANNPDNLNLISSWVGGVVPGTANAAVWNNTVTSANTTLLGGDLTFGGISIVNPTGPVTIDAGNTLTLGSATIDLNLSAAEQDLTVNCNLAMASTNVWDVQSGRTATLGGVVSGSAAVNKKGAGSVILSGVNTYNGSTVITAGELTIVGAGQLGSGSYAGTIGNAGTFTYGSTATQTLSGAISGVGTLIKSGAGTLTLSSATTNYNGPTSLTNGTLVLANTGAFASAGTVNAGTTLQMSPTASHSMNSIGAMSLLGTLTYNPAGNFFQTLSTAALNNGITVSGGTSVINVSAVALAVNNTGLYVDGGLKGSSALTVNAASNGVGLVLRTANSNYSGTMIVNGNASPTAGTGSGLAIVGAVTLSSANLTINGTLELGDNAAGMGWAKTGVITGTSTSINALNGTGVVVGNFAAAATRNLSVGNNGGTGSFSGIITNGANNTLSFTKAGTGTQTLSNSNSYTGGTNVNGGTLLLSGAVNMPATGALQVNAGGNFSLADGTVRTATTAASLNLASGSGLTFDWDAGATDTLTSTAAATAVGTVGIYINPLNSPTGSDLTLLSAPLGGLTSGGASYFLVNNTDYTATLTTSDTTVQIGSYAAATPLTGAAYWLGGQVAGAPGAMALSSGGVSNWASDAGGTLAGPVVPGASNDVFFSATGATQQGSVVLGGNMTLNSVTFNDTTPVTIGSGGTLTLNSAGTGAASAISANQNATINAGVALGAAHTWTVANAMSLSIGGVVSGGFGLTKSDTGSLTLTGANTYSGGTTIDPSSGTVQANVSTTANGVGTGAVAIGSGSTLLLNNTNNSGTTVSINNIFTGAGLLKLQFNSVAATNTIMPNVTGVSGTIQLSTLGATGDKWNAANLGTIAGALIVDSGTQLFVPSGITSFTGGITLDGVGNTENRGGIRLGGTLGGNVNLATSSTISMESVVSAFLTGNITSGAAGTQILTLGGTGSTGGTLSGIIGGGTDTIALATAVGGSYTLTNANTYTGATDVNAGALILQNPTALGTTAGGTLVANGARVELDNITVTGEAITLIGAGGDNLGALRSRSGASVWAGPVTVNADLTRIGAITGSTMEVSGVIDDGVNDYRIRFRPNSATATVIVSGANTYTGGTSIFGGIVVTSSFNSVVGGTASSNFGAPVTVANGLIILGIAATNNDPILRYIGGGETTDRTIQIGENSAAPVVGDNGGGAIENNGASGALVFSAANFNTPTNALTGTSPTRVLTIGGTNTAANTISGIIQNNQVAGNPTAAVAITKTGIGSWTLAGANIYTGNTTVSAGTLILADNAQLKFVIGATSGTNNSVGGVGTFTVDGDFNIDTTIADATALTTGSWTLVNAATLTETFNPSFTIEGGGWTEAADVWTKTVGGKNYTFTEATGILTLSSWASVNGASANLNEDHDFDGVANGIEYFIGGPSGNTTGFTALPGVVNTAGTLSITWPKAATYTGTYGTHFWVETSSTLTGVWTTEIADPNVGFTVTFPSATEVKYTFPAGTSNFARLRVTGP